MNYRDMPIGREMDAMIAEKVFEWRVVDREAMAFWPSLEEVKKIVKENPHVLGINYHGCPEFSADVGAAFQVVAKMQGRGYWLELKSPFFEGEQWWAGFTPLYTSGWNGEPDNNMPGSSAMLAICRSALYTMAEVVAFVDIGANNG